MNLQIQRCFGALPPEMEACLQAAVPEQLETWALRILTAESVEEMFSAGDELEQKLH